ncbi:YnfA family protein [Campylobacter sp. MIT 12-8780]|uniref:YnfA family protein n=1 Tax=unclassified Campylobacter TaxID=2593542 RepID=UPI00115D8EFB|nr:MULTISPECIES: YnfA family protein [unclassified Campylobacter]NDJ26539.1 YnfA family protein [Campylobacter sp. MIT 19-121]TQR43111.1 YnfA family protein [Campylobacter sp. MIT 12-8780]
MNIFQSISFFFLACLFEVGGAYLVWLWLKEGKSFYLGLLGLVALGLYGVIASFQPQSFGRVFASYGGFFIVFSLLWAMIFDDFKPDFYDILGSALTLLGVALIAFAPR